MIHTLDLGTCSLRSESSTSIFSMPESTSTPEELHCFSLLSSTSIGCGGGDGFVVGSVGTAAGNVSAESLDGPGAGFCNLTSLSEGPVLFGETLVGVVSRFAKRARRLRLICNFF